VRATNRGSVSAVSDLVDLCANNCAWAAGLFGCDPRLSAALADAYSTGSRTGCCVTSN
jgi:hypothetical protein